MTRATKYAGLDVHQATTLASVRGETGQVIARTVLPTEGRALTEFVHGMRGAIHVAFEEGTQAQWLHDLLVPVVQRVVVCDRHGEKRRGNKGDRGDADQLSARLWRGELRAVYHGSPHRATLQELSRTYRNLVEDTTRVMLRLKALFRARAIPTPGTRVYQPAHRAVWLARLPERGVRFRAETLYAELDVLLTLRPRAKTALLAEARRDPAWGVLRTIPYLGPVRVALLLAVLQTPWRIRSKRHLWCYAGLAVITETSAEHELRHGRPVRRRRAPLTRGLNPNHNRVVTDVFKGATTAATARPGPLQDFYRAMIWSRDARGVGAGDAHPEARRAHAAALEKRRSLRSDAVDAASALGAGFRSLARDGPRQRLPMPRATVRGAVSSRSSARPQSPRHSSNCRPPRKTRRSLRPAQRAESPIEPWSAVRDPSACECPSGSGVESR